MRKLLTIRWIGFHLLTFGCVVLFAILGHWQWDVGGSHRGTIRNYAYGVEWWVFAAILVLLWMRLMRQELTGETTATGDRVAAARPRTPRDRAPAPQVAVRVDETEDPEMAAYNRYLAALHKTDMATGGRRGRR